MDVGEPDGSDPVMTAQQPGLILIETKSPLKLKVAANV